MLGLAEPLRFTATGEVAYGTADKDGRGEELAYVQKGDVGVYEGDEKRKRGWNVIVSTHRLILIDPSELRSGLCLPLAWVENVEAENPGFGALFSSPKLRIDLLEKPRDPSKPPPHEMRSGIIRLSFHGGSRDRDAVLESFRRALQRKEWAGKPSLDMRAEVAARAAPTLGGIARVRAERQAEAEYTTELAAASMSDIEALVEHAGKIAKIADLYAKRLSAMKRDNDETPDVAWDEKLGAINEALGLSNPVTKEMAGATFHRDLARQIVTFAS